MRQRECLIVVLISVLMVGCNGAKKCRDRRRGPQKLR